MILTGLTRMKPAAFSGGFCSFSFLWRSDRSFWKTTFKSPPFLLWCCQQLEFSSCSSIVDVHKLIYKGFFYCVSSVASMRKYLLTSHERKILETFIKEGVRLEGFSTITSRLKNWDKEYIEQDLKLIEEATRKLNALSK